MGQNVLFSLEEKAYTRKTKRKIGSEGRYRGVILTSTVIDTDSRVTVNCVKADARPLAETRLSYVKEVSVSYGSTVPTLNPPQSAENPVKKDVSVQRA